MVPWVIAAVPVVVVPPPPPPPPLQADRRTITDRQTIPITDLPIRIRVFITTSSLFLQIERRKHLGCSP
jgi:hypothetical protein